MSEIKEVDIVDAENLELRQQYNGQQTSAGGLILTPKKYEFSGIDAFKKGEKFLNKVRRELKKLCKDHNEQPHIFWKLRPNVLTDKITKSGEIEKVWLASFTTWPPSPMIHLIYKSLNPQKVES